MKTQEKRGNGSKQPQTRESQTCEHHPDSCPDEFWDEFDDLFRKFDKLFDKFSDVSEDLAKGTTKTKIVLSDGSWIWRTTTFILGAATIILAMILAETSTNGCVANSSQPRQNNVGTHIVRPSPAGAE
jgi:hypothetical protein